MLSSIFGPTYGGANTKPTKTTKPTKPTKPNKKVETRIKLDKMILYKNRKRTVYTSSTSKTFYVQDSVTKKFIRVNPKEFTVVSK